MFEELEEFPYKDHFFFSAGDDLGKVCNAPLEISSRGSKAEDIFFEGVSFPAGTELSGTYVFNSYRLTYRYDIVKKPRVEDVLAAATYRISDLVAIRAGCRILEGGADNDEVYNFSLFNYATAGVTLTFGKKDKTE